MAVDTTRGISDQTLQENGLAAMRASDLKRLLDLLDDDVIVEMLMPGSLTLNDCEGRYIGFVDLTHRKLRMYYSDGRGLKGGPDDRQELDSAR